MAASRAPKQTVTMKRHDSFFIFRAALCALAALIGSLGAWAVAGEIISPRSIYFPTNPDEAEALYAKRRPAETAADIGVVRGDLWTVAAVTSAAPMLFGAASSSPRDAQQAEAEKARTFTERAARLSPHDSRIWLVLADLDFRSGGSNRKTLDALKLSYYTGPNEFSLIPLRLLLAVQTDATSDEEMQSLVSLDIRRIIMQRPDLKPAITSAYKNALPKGRDIIEATLKQADPDFLAKLK